MLDIESVLALVSNMTQDSLRKQGIKTLGQITKALKECKVDSKVYFDFCDLGPTTLDSYRGYYNHLAFSYSENNPTVRELLEILTAANGQTFEGWKGGDYMMGDDTPVWVAERGSSTGTAIVEVVDMDWRVMLKTAYLE